MRKYPKLLHYQPRLVYDEEIEEKENYLKNKAREFRNRLNPHKFDCFISDEKSSNTEPEKMNTIKIQNNWFS